MQLESLRFTSTPEKTCAQHVFSLTWNGSVKPSRNMPPQSLNSLLSDKRAPKQWRLEEFDFELDPSLIAQHPASPRSASKLLDARASQRLDRQFRELPSLLNTGDLLIFNDTEVVKARLFGEKSTGGQVELLIERVLSNKPNDAPAPSNQVVAHMRVSKKPPLGATLFMHGGFTATLLSRWPHPDGPLFLFSLSA